jgi:hypothetical protein
VPTGFGKSAAHVFSRDQVAADDTRVANRIGSCVSELRANEADAELIELAGSVFLMWRTLDIKSRDIIRHWVTEMAHGMRAFVLKYPNGIRIATVAEFREYCYFVAGTVGHLLTDSRGGEDYARRGRGSSAFANVSLTHGIHGVVAYLKILIDQSASERLHAYQFTPTSKIRALGCRSCGC